MKEITKFARWIRKISPRRGMVCHFYFGDTMSGQGEKLPQRQYFSPTDFAFFNLFSGSSSWIVKGTTDHGISDERGRTSIVPCLNCFNVDEIFIDSLIQLQEEGNEKFELGLILNKRRLKGLFGSDNIQDVIEWKGGKRPMRRDCWRYDIPKFRKGVLDPFNYCNVVRIKTPKSKLREEPIVTIPLSIVMGLLIRERDYRTISNFPITEYNVEVFPLL